MRTCVEEEGVNFRRYRRGIDGKHGDGNDFLSGTLLRINVLVTEKDDIIMPNVKVFGVVVTFGHIRLFSKNIGMEDKVFLTDTANGFQADIDVREGELWERP